MTASSSTPPPRAGSLDEHLGDAPGDGTAAARGERSYASEAGELAEPIDWPGLLESLDGDEDFARELAQTYIDSAEALLSDLAAAVERGDCLTAGSTAHALKGASANVRAGRVADAAARLEAAARDGERDRLEALAAKLTGDLAAAADDLRSKVSPRR